MQFIQFIGRACNVYESHLYPIVLSSGLISYSTVVVDILRTNDFVHKQVLYNEVKNIIGRQRRVDLRLIMSCAIYCYSIVFPLVTSY